MDELTTLALIWELLKELKRKMKIRKLLINLFLLISIPSLSQHNTDEFSILFYNVENLFDTRDDSETSDEEYTPNGDRYWNYKKLNLKLQNISKVILSSNGWEMPAIVALSEIENREVLELLTKKTPLKSVKYKIIHKESPDPRGIDVALLYDPNRFYPISYKHYPMLRKSGTIKKTREILYVSGIANGQDTVHIFVNHWSSRYSGVLETREKRNSAAMLLRQKIDVLFEEYVSPKIVIIGDFNDQPYDKSMLDFLGANKSNDTPVDNELYNLSYLWRDKKKGTLKYQMQWLVFDQIIVSGTLLNAKRGMRTDPNNATIIDFPFLLEKDEKYGGVKPKRTFYGYSYLGGFSDHLPVLLKLNNVD